MSGLYPMNELRVGQPYPIAQGLYPMEQIAAGQHYALGIEYDGLPPPTCTVRNGKRRCVIKPPPPPAPKKKRVKLSIASGLYPMEEQRVGQPYPIAQGLYPMEQIAAGPHYGPMVPGARSIAGAKARRCKGGRIWHPLLGTCVLARPAKLSKKAKAKAKKAKAIAGWNVNMRPYPCNGAM